MSIYNDFMGTVQAGGLTNPYGLAAVAATGKHESGYSPGNAYGAWSDPAESGAPGTAGGILSWRAERLDAMRRFAADRGEDPRRPSPQTQAEFFLAEDPALVSRLNEAGSAEEAIGLMNGAWRFAGYDRAGGEAARRLATTRSILGGAEIQDGSGGGSRYTRDTSSKGSTMAYPPGRAGGLGGLGGMPVAEEEPEPQGGLAGFFNEPGVADVFRAMGMSMMSAPRNNPFALVSEILPGLQAQREKSEERKADRASLAAALQGLGMSPEEAATYSRNPEAAQLILDRHREDEQRERNREFARTLTGGDAYSGASYGDPTMTDADPTLSDPVLPSAGRTTTISGGASMGAPLMGMPDTADAADVDVAENSVPMSTPATPSGNKTHVWGQGLYQEADRLRQVGMMAETAEQRAAVEYALDGVNANIRRYEAWAEKQGDAPNLETIITEDGTGEQKGYFRSGEFVPVGGVKRIGGSGDMTATDRKAIFAAEDDAVVLDSTIDSLSRALELNDQAYEGWTAANRGDVGYNLGGVGEYLGFDQDAARATREYQNIMTGEAAAAMSATLKGATTDRELGIFMGIIGDLNIDPATRKRTIQKLLTMAERKRDTLHRRADDLRGGTYYQPGGGSSGSRAASSSPAAGSSGRTSSGLSWSVD